MTLKYFLVLLLLTASTHLFAQKIIINGTEGNRLLQWSDFSGQPDNSNPYFANTHWDFSYRFSSTKFNGDVAEISGFEIVLQLNPYKSWVKKGKETDELLKHEQGHFNVGLLFSQEVLKKIKTASFTRNNFAAELQKLVSEIFKKYNAMNEQYDNETNHSMNKEAQARWNEFFSKEPAQ